MEHGYALAATLNQGLLIVATTTALASGATGEKRQDKQERLRAANSGDVKRCARGKNSSGEERKRRGEGSGGRKRGGEEGRGVRGEGEGRGEEGREPFQAQCGWKTATWKAQTY